MAHTRRYTRLEKNIVSRIVHAFGAFFSSVGRLCVRIVKFFDGKLTLMIVPHSNGKVVSVQTNVFALILGLAVISGVACSFVYFNHRNTASGTEI